MRRARISASKRSRRTRPSTRVSASRVSHVINSVRRGRLKVVEPKARLDGGELVVARRGAPREFGDDIGLDPDLFGDVVEHHRRQQLSPLKVAPRIAQAAKLESVAKPGRRRARRRDRGEVARVEAVVADRRRLAVRQRQQLGALPRGHGYASRHRRSSKNLLPFGDQMKEDYERQNMMQRRRAVRPSGYGRL